MSTSNIININSILGIKDFTSLEKDNGGEDENLFEDLGFGYIRDIIENCKFEPIIVDLTVSRQEKWSAVAFKNKKAADNYLSAYLSALKYMLVDKKRPLFFHPGFDEKQNIIICKQPVSETIEETIEKITIDATHDTNVIKINENIHLYKYMDTLISSNTEENSSEPQFSPEENAKFLYSAFHSHNKCNSCSNGEGNICFFVAIPITRVRNLKEGKREPIGGAFLIVKGEYNEDNIKLMCLRILSVFLRGLIDWHVIKDTIENCGVEKWLKLRKECIKIEGDKYQNVPAARHWEFGGGGVTSEKKKIIETFMKDTLYKQYVAYINDIDTYEPYRWKDWGKPPIRAMAQGTDHAKDLLIFMKLLQDDLSSHNGNLEIYFQSMLVPQNFGLKCLWFNPVPLGKTLENICAGLNGLTRGNENFFNADNKARVVIEYGFEEINDNNIFLYFNIYEYMRPYDYIKPKEDKNAKKLLKKDKQYEFSEIPYKSNCWTNSTNSLKLAIKNLYICGVRKMFYSGFDSQSQNFKTQMVTLNQTDSLKVSAISQDHNFRYKKRPPFLSFGIEGNIEQYTRNTDKIFIINVVSEQNNMVNIFFQKEFCNESNSD